MSIYTAIQYNTWPAFERSLEELFDLQNDEILSSLLVIGAEINSVFDPEFSGKRLLFSLSNNAGLSHLRIEFSSERLEKVTSILKDSDSTISNFIKFLADKIEFDPESGVLNVSFIKKGRPNNLFINRREVLRKYFLRSNLIKMHE